MYSLPLSLSRGRNVCREGAFVVVVIVVVEKYVDVKGERRIDTDFFGYTSVICRRRNEKRRRTKEPVPAVVFPPLFLSLSPDFFSREIIGRSNRGLTFNGARISQISPSPKRRVRI